MIIITREGLSKKGIETVEEVVKQRLTAVVAKL